MPALAPGRVALLSYTPGGGAQTITGATLTVTASIVARGLTKPTPAPITGATLTVTASIVGGGLTAGGIPTQTITGQTVIVAASIATSGITGTGTRSLGGATLTATVAVIAGGLTGSGAGPIAGTAVTVSSSVTAGGMTGGEVSLRIYGPIHAYREPSTHTYREGRMSAQVTTTYRTVDEDPGIAYSWLDRDGSVIDLSGATFSLVVTNLQGTTELTKTSGITGSATSPNVVISWDAGELATLGVGTYLYKLTATTSSRQRTLGAGTPHRLIVTA